MKQLSIRLREVALLQRVPQEVIEKDYAISYVLAGISAQQELRDALVLKGGTALKKLFFGEYRFSEDLDFSSTSAPTGEKLEDALNEAVREAGRMISVQGPFALQVERYLERNPHPLGQDAFTIRVRFPWQRQALCRLKIEISHTEPVLMKPELRTLLHGYEEKLDCQVQSYPLEEIVAEKLRALLQTHQKLVTRGWNQPRARDYYDLWRILEDYGERLQKPVIIDLLNRKAAHRAVSWESLDDFFTQELVAEAIRTWDSNLGTFVADLPECSIVLRQLRVSLSALLLKSP
ncbi:MAG: nucleotidyl transferase AbiEii/AbiGii toxin family protein [Dehalococcoidia bacterium]|nr:nucleotidyl transferase AbiEii/AbiGii toxin family protein [Dehalococcoidia bacterium]